MLCDFIHIIIRIGLLPLRLAPDFNSAEHSHQNKQPTLLLKTSPLKLNPLTSTPLISPLQTPAAEIGG